MVSKKNKDKHERKTLKKKIGQKRIKTIKERREIKKRIQEEYILESNFNDFDKMITSYKAVINEIDPKKGFFNRNINLTFINMVDTYLKNSSFTEKNHLKFIQKFIEIINILSMNKNEFVFWSLLIDEYMKLNQNIPNNYLLEKLFFIALCSKEKLYPNYSIFINEFKKIDNNFNNWYNINKSFLEKDLDLLNVFNDRYKKLNYIKNFQKTFYYDYKSEVDYICNYSSIIEKKENDNKTIIKDSKSYSDSTETNNLLKTKSKIKESKINENINNVNLNINKSDDECHNNSICFYDVNSVNKLGEKNSYDINNYVNEGISIKNSKEELEQNNGHFQDEYSERKLSPNPYDDYNFFIDSFNEISPNENYNLGNLLEYENSLDESGCQPGCFPFHYNFKSDFKITDEKI